MARKAVGSKFGKFGDNEREAYLNLRSEGVGKINAAKGVGVCDDTVRQYAKENPEWDQLDRKAASQANESVENALFQAALKGSVAGCCAWLYNREPDTWKDRRKGSDDFGGDAFDMTRLTADEREELLKAINKTLGAETESTVGSVQRNGLLPH